MPTPDGPLSYEAMDDLLKQENPIIRKQAIEIISQQIKIYKLPIKLITIDGLTRRVNLFGEATDAWLDRFITKNEAMLLLKEHVRKLAKIQDEVLISGPTGTGKELIALALHGQKEGKFIPVNCAGLPDNLVESLMFGHKRGSFTGAHAERVGAMVAAANGTFFLDEIGELPMESQGAFLRVLQSHKITPVGATDEVEINCRIVCATNRNLRERCEQGLFRLDLYARLSTFELHTTALSERTEDIRPILESLEGGKEFLTAYLTSKSVSDDLDISLNVRSLQQHVKRHKVLGKLP